MLLSEQRRCPLRLWRRVWQRNVPSVIFFSTSPVQIRPATATTTKAWARCASIVRPTNAHTCAICARLLRLLLQLYTILGMARIERGVMARLHVLSGYL